MTDDIRDNDANDPSTATGKFIRYESDGEGMSTIYGKPKRGRKAKPSPTETYTRTGTIREVSPPTVTDATVVDSVVAAERVVEEAIAPPVEDPLVAAPEAVYLVLDERGLIVRATWTRESAEHFIGEAPGYQIERHAVESPPGVRLTRWWTANIDLETGNLFRVAIRDSAPNYSAGEGVRILGPYRGTYGTSYIRVDSSTSYDHAVSVARVARERALRGESVDGR